MHVTCTNCGARYAVEATAIGPAGRTVQCVRCNHRWFQKPDTPAAPKPATPIRPAAPDFVIRPPAQGAGLPALTQPPGKSRWGTWVAVVIGLVVLLGAAAYAYRGEIKARLPSEWRTLLNVDAVRSLLASPAKAARTAAPIRARLTLDVGASKVELVDGRYVVQGEVVNTGGAAGSTRALKLVFRAGEEVLGEHTMPLVEGPIAPGGRASFRLPLDEPPAGTTNIVPTID
jgi:predicted Zn finger-like uncharacterized protein